MTWRLLTLFGFWVVIVEVVQTFRGSYSGFYRNFLDPTCSHRKICRSVLIMEYGMINYYLIRLQTTHSRPHGTGKSIGTVDGF